jgi:aconitase A
MFNENEFIINCDGILPINFNCIKKEKDLKKEKTVDVKKEKAVDVEKEKTVDVKKAHIDNKKIIYDLIQSFTYA